jgi:hypothetical protein
MSIQTLQTLHVDGIFDCKWQPNSKVNEHLGTVDSNGVLQLYRLNETYELTHSNDTNVTTQTEKCSYELVSILSKTISEKPNNMGLSLDWNGRHRNHANTSSQIITSSSNGTIANWSVCIHMATIRSFPSY